jgi:hypothetical protein
MDDIIRDSNGNKITTGDKVKFLSRIDKIVREGLITKMTGGTFGIKCDKYIMLYKYKEVDKHMISKIKK